MLGEGHETLTFSNRLRDLAQQYSSGVSAIGVPIRRTRYDIGEQIAAPRHGHR